MQYHSGTRAVSDLKVHLVLTTKYRKKVLTNDMLERLSELTQNFCNNWQCEVIEFNGEADHIHLLFKYYPQLQLSKFVNSFKTTTSRLIRKEFSAEVDKVYWKPVLWHSSYFLASCGGVTVDVWRRYIENQKGDSSQRSSKTERGASHLE